MIIFYVESKNGNYSSENGNRRFDKLTGQKVFDFLKSEAGKGRRFMKVNDDGELNKVYVEVPSDQVRAIRKDERHKQYLSDCRNASGYDEVASYLNAIKYSLNDKGRETKRILERFTDAANKYNDKLFQTLLAQSVDDMSF